MGFSVMLSEVPKNWCLPNTGALTDTILFFLRNVKLNYLIKKYKKYIITKGCENMTAGYQVMAIKRKNEWKVMHGCINKEKVLKKVYTFIYNTSNQCVSLAKITVIHH